MLHNDSVSRRKKLNHVDTILYEIDMLDYCYDRLRGHKWADERDYYLCIEGFLLHYRNLIQFFGNDQGLKAEEANKWSPRELTAEEVISIQNKDLFGRYSGLISRYLSHCTQNRAERDVEWQHIEMYEEIRPLLENFRTLFPSKHQASKGISILSEASASTATVSHYESGLLHEPAMAPRKKD
jgi:hypothetical protein